MSDVHVKGFAELQAFLDQLPAKMEANIMRSALRAGAKVIAEEAKRLVPVHLGDLRKSIRVTSRISKSGVITATAKAGNRKAWYWRFVEFGTAAHWVSIDQKYKPTRTTRRGVTKAYSMKTINKMTRSGSLVIGGHFVGVSVAHPGARPSPFMRPALDSQTEAAIQAVGEQIKKRLTKQGLNAADIDIEIETE